MSASDSGGTVREVLELALQAEEKAGDVYHRFSKLFSHVPEVSAFWEGLEQDERRHVMVLQEVRRSPPEEQLADVCEGMMLDKIQRAHRQLGRVMETSVKNLNDAYEAAHEVEFSEIDMVFEFLTTGLVSRGKLYLDLRVAQPQQKLSDFREDFGDESWRKGIGVHTAGT